MARPTKQGIDYFPIDCQLDDKHEMFLIEKGAAGLGVLVTLWQMIYSNEGYYVENNTDLHLLVKRKIDVDVNEVSDVINVCLRRNIFDEEMHAKHGILTSKAIQKRFFEAAKKKKKVAVNGLFVINGINSSENWVYVGGNATNVKEEVKVKEEVNNTPPNPPAKADGETPPDEEKKPRRKRKSGSDGILLSEYLEKCETEQVSAVPSDDKIFEYAKTVNLHRKFVLICWLSFKAEHTDPEHKNGKRRQKDWRAHFRNFVRKNYYKLWYPDQSGGFMLTTAGEQARREFNVSI